MKAFVIKNKEGKYIQSAFYYDFVNTLVDCTLFSTKQDAEHELSIDEDCKDCEVVEITIVEGNLEEENRVLKRAYESACKKLAYLFGECPYSNMNLPMPEYCDEECINNEKYLCWDKYFIEQAKGEER